MAVIRPLNRGLFASEEDKREVEQVAQQLEKLNPNPKALASPLINGRWELLYTTSESILGTKRPAFFRPSGPIYQILGEPPLLWHSAGIFEINREETEDALLFQRTEGCMADQKTQLFELTLAKLLGLGQRYLYCKPSCHFWATCNCAAVFAAATRHEPAMPLHESRQSCSEVVACFL